MAKRNLLAVVVATALIAYGAVYIFAPHDLHVNGLALDWILANAGLTQGGFDHPIHTAIGAVILFAGLYVAHRWSK